MEADELNQVSACENNLARASGWAGVADQKAGFILTLTLVVLGYLTTQLGDFFSALFSKWSASPSAPALFVFLILVLLTALVGMVGAIINLVSLIRPRLAPASAKQSLLFFQTIAPMPCDEFTQALTTLDQKGYVNALCDQTHNVSKIVVEKFRKLNASINWFWVGVGAVVVFSFFRPLFVKLLER
ncbi:MAG TPA: Pycsar system effector family protein [Pyrinomonadaceae bacterium]|nr:Pycsar system effector family protein [Pyrinomonadaceae bacterium]